MIFRSGDLGYHHLEVRGKRERRDHCHKVDDYGAQCRHRNDVPPDLRVITQVPRPGDRVDRDRDQEHRQIDHVIPVSRPFEHAGERGAEHNMR